VLCVVLAGGFTTNCLWCVGLIVKNKSAPQWLGRHAQNHELPLGVCPSNRSAKLLEAKFSRVSWHVEDLS
jgi:L-rhamnose-H+ transport protein